MNDDKSGLSVTAKFVLIGLFVVLALFCLAMWALSALAGEQVKEYDYRFQQEGLYNNKIIMSYYLPCDSLSVKIVIYHHRTTEVVNTLVRNNGSKGSNIQTWSGENNKKAKMPSGEYDAELFVSDALVNEERLVIKME